MTALLQSLEAANPFSSAMGRKYSSYMGVDNEGTPTRLLDAVNVDGHALAVHRALLNTFDSAEYPCIGAKAAFNSPNYRFGMYPAMGSRAAVAGLARDLWLFTHERRHMGTEFTTFVAVFADSAAHGASGFERSLWRQLQNMRDLDHPFHRYDPSVSADPTSVEFAFSFAETAFFVVGMQPDSPRQARRFPWPALAFNAHDQFRRLRSRGLYVRFQKIIRERELALQGSLNPNLSEFGTASEAAQYAGHPVDADWVCPFRG